MPGPSSRRAWRNAGLLAAVLSIALAACGGSSGAAAAGSSSSKAATSSSGGSGQLTTVTVGELPSNAAAGFLDMGQAKDFFKNYGVKVEVKELTSADQLTPALISGAVDMIDESPGAAMVAISKGALKAKIIGSSMPGLPWMIVANKNIKTMAELSGHSMGVSSATGLPNVVAELMLKKNGVNPSTMHFVNTGNNAQRFEEVVNGTLDSASVPSDFVPQAKKAGLNVLALASHEIPLYPRFTIIARDDFLAAHPQAAVGYLAGVIQGERYAFAHPNQAKALAAKALGGKATPSSPSVVNMYDQIVSDKLVNRNGQIPMSMLQYLQTTLINIGLLKKPLNLNTIYVDTYRQQAVQKVNAQGTA